MTPVTGAIAYNELASLGLSTVAPHLANNVDLQSSHLVIAYCFELHRSCVRHVRRRNGGLGIFLLMELFEPGEYAVI